MPIFEVKVEKYFKIYLINNAFLFLDRIVFVLQNLGLFEPLNNTKNTSRPRDHESTRSQMVDDICIIVSVYSRGYVGIKHSFSHQ